jgi:hypothetical protein
MRPAGHGLEVRQLGGGRDEPPSQPLDLDLDQAAVVEPASAPGLDLRDPDVAQEDPAGGAEPREAGVPNRLEQQVVVGGRIGRLLEEPGGSDELRSCVDASERRRPAADHRLTDPPQVVQRDAAVLPATVALDALAIADREVAVGDFPPLGEDATHLVDRLAVLRERPAAPRVIVDRAPHDDAVERQGVDGPHGQPAAVLEEPALAVG